MSLCQVCNYYARTLKASASPLCFHLSPGYCLASGAQRKSHSSFYLIMYEMVFELIKQDSTIIISNTKRKCHSKLENKTHGSEDLKQG